MADGHQTRPYSQMLDDRFTRPDPNIERLRDITKNVVSLPQALEPMIKATVRQADTSQMILREQELARQASVEARAEEVRRHRQVMIAGWGTFALAAIGVILAIIGLLR